MAHPSIFSKELLQDFTAALQPLLAGTLRTDTLSRQLYASDASIYQIQPLAVLLPKHLDDVQAALEVASRFRIPILPRGGGSSLAGQTVGAALVIDFTPHLHDILEVNSEERWVRVQPGLVLDTLNARLASMGLMVGPDPASSSCATLGGMVGNNSTGTHSIRYGSVINHLRALKAFLADGTSLHFEALDLAAWNAKLSIQGKEGDLYRGLENLLLTHGDTIRRDTPTHWRRNSGYRLEYLLDSVYTYEGLVQRTPYTRNVAHLLCGSEGTLAVTSEVTLSLVSRPRHALLGIAHFASRQEALRATTTILETDPSAVELFDGVAIALTRKMPGYAAQLSFLEGDPGAILITEYAGEDLRALEDSLERLSQKLSKSGQGYAVVKVMKPAQIAQVWAIRKAGLGLIMSAKGAYRPLPVIEDASVPVENLADYIDDLDALFAETRTPAAYYAHASAGCLHVRPFFDLHRIQEREKLKEISRGSMALVKKYGGVLASEHGDGIVRGWLNPDFLGPQLCEAYRQLKQLFDPEGLLNPGKVLDTPMVTENLRPGLTSSPTLPLVSLDWSQDGDFGEAVERCNGSGACRKLQGGAMCPSYRITRDEEHAPRGRANALRAMLAGQLSSPDQSERIYEVLDLCIQCKACKTECPSGVDVARMKTEWLSGYWENHEMPRRAKLFAHQPQTARKLNGGLKARLANTLMGMAPVRLWMDRAWGISHKRKLPKFAAQPFTHWAAHQRPSAEGIPVVLFADTFTNYHYPEIARAAYEFLERTGHQVIVSDSGACCGRPLLSKGLVVEAQEQAFKTIDALYPYVEYGFPIIGLEPSCILTFTDEYLTLVPGDLRMRQVADAAITFEQYVVKKAKDGFFQHVRWKEVSGKILLHGHCHQKALVGMTPSEQCLTLPGYTVETLDNSCCGMAGAFGYEKEHYDLSIRMAEAWLTPAIRTTEANTVIAAAGVSCRAQIADTTGRKALHPAEILRDALAD